MAVLDLSTLKPILDSEDASRVLIATAYENERPLRGIAGLIDWRCDGDITRALKAGTFSGKPGDVLLVPVPDGAKVRRALIIGMGYMKEKREFSKTALPALAKNMSSMGIKRAWASTWDFGMHGPQAEDTRDAETLIQQALVQAQGGKAKETPVEIQWITPRWM